MRLVDGEVFLSATDLMRFQGCRHATALDLRLLQGEALQPAEDDASARLVQEKGIAHEAAYLETLKAKGSAVAEIDRKLSFPEAVQETERALRSGADVVFQGALRSGQWGGYADFLERVARPSKLGPFSYEVVDTKLKRKPDPRHILQLCLYADLLVELQGTLPEQVHVQLGDGKRASFRILDYGAYARRLRGRLGAFVAAPEPTTPDPVSACSLCRWRDVCDDYWETTDSLCLVANIRRSQRQKLEAAGINTLAKLATTTQRVPKLAPETLAKLQLQARLQHERRRGGKPSFELRAIAPGTGLSRLPKPAPGDLFFDMEGDPFSDGGLEYLFGLLWNEAEAPRYKAFWAHDKVAEARAASDVLEFFRNHLRKHPDAHIYHYNSYEVTALRRLASTHAVHEAVLDDLLRKEKFVDLYRVVQQGIVASEPSYSLKDLEAFYLEKRTGEVATAGDSIVAYQAFRETGDAAILEEIRAYNETDCRSTLGLRDWIVTIVRPKGHPWFKAQTDAEKAAEVDAADLALAKERENLQHKLAPAKDRLGEAAADLLFELAWFHKREAKPAWWAIFDSAQAESEVLLDNLDCLAGLTASGPARAVKKSKVRPYRLLEQETKRQAGDRVPARLEGLPEVTIEELDLDALTASIKFGPRISTPPDALDLLPPKPLETETQRAAIHRLIDDVAANREGREAIEALLRRDAPRFNERKAGSPIIENGNDLIFGVIDAVKALDKSCLPIQGPPGTGKTYVSSHAILALALAGKRVAVSSNSHKAIDNLLLSVAARAREAGRTIPMAKKVSRGDEGPSDEMIVVTSDNDDGDLQTAKVVGGTSWLFARKEFDQTFDYLFVDEAGQVSLANAVAMATCARNIVLVGDPMQLPQPIQGVHPGDSGLSSLEFILTGHSTVPPDKGIFLPITRRMHPDVCRYISDVVYDSRLSSDPATARQAILWGATNATRPPTGIAFVEVDSNGNSQSSEEEARAIASTIRELLGANFTDQKGKTRALALDDILVVAPYNAQVNLLRRSLPAGARVGTVDKFQGQEAPVCLISMTTSSGDELPRDVAFLFSTNRLNVAVSRAQALSIVFASPRLLDVPCRSPEEMKLVNTLCALREYAQS